MATGRNDKLKRGNLEKKKTLLVEEDADHEIEPQIPVLLVRPVVSAAEKKSIKEHKDLITYPTVSRTFSFLVKLAWGVLFGAGTVVGVIALVPTAHLLIVGALVVGAGVFAIKAARDAYKKNQEEKKLTKIVNDEIDASIVAIQTINIDRLVELGKSFEDDRNPDPSSAIRKEKLYAHLFEMEQAIEKLMPYIKAKKPGAVVDNIVDIKNGISALKLTVNRLRSEPGQPPKEEFLTPAPRLPIARPQGKTILGSLWTGTKKISNRALSFLGGASTAVTVGVVALTFFAGVAGTVALLSNPVGWAFLSIIAGAVVVGAAAVAIDYYMARSQQKKIDKLTTAKFTVESRGKMVTKLGADIDHIGVEQAAKLENNKKHALLQADKSSLSATLSEQAASTARLKTALDQESEKAAKLESDRSSLAAKLAEQTAASAKLQEALDKEQAALAQEHEKAARLVEENLRLKAELEAKVAVAAPVPGFGSSPHSFHAVSGGSQSARPEEEIVPEKKPDPNSTSSK